MSSEGLQRGPSAPAEASGGYPVLPSLADADVVRALTSGVFSFFFVTWEADLSFDCGGICFSDNYLP